MTEYYNPKACSKCKGRCCQIYYTYYEGAPMGLSGRHTFEYFHKYIHSKAEEYDVEPIYDALAIHTILRNNFWLERINNDPRLKNNPEGIASMCKYVYIPTEVMDVTPVLELISKGVDPSFCEYYSYETGCIIERPKRSSTCTQFSCHGDDLSMKLWGYPYIADRWNKKILPKEKDFWRNDFYVAEFVKKHLGGDSNVRATG